MGKLLTEEISGSRNSAIVYHRTKSIENIKGIINNGFDPGDGDGYGKGFYSFHTNQVENDFMKKHGNIILKCVVTNLRGNFLIFDKQEAQKIYGENYQLEDQMPNLPQDCIDYLKTRKGDFNHEIVLLAKNEFKDIFKNVIGKELAGIVLPKEYISMFICYKPKKTDGFLYITGYKKDDENEYTKIRYNQEFKEPNDINNLNENKVLNNYIKYKVKQILNAN